MSAEQGPSAAQQHRQGQQDQDTEMPQAPAVAESHPGQQPSTTSPPPPPPPAPAHAENAGPEPESTPDPQEKQAPLIPGPRASRLQALFASTVKHTLDKISKDNFASCFPTIAAKAPGTLEFVQRQMVERLGGLWNKEFETILQNRHVVARLNELEALISDAVRRREEEEATGDGTPPIPPHTLPADVILAAHLAPHLASHRSQLNARLQNTQAANARLFDEIRAQRAEMEALVAGVEKAVRDVDGANGLLSEVVEELAAETRAADREVEAATARARTSGGW
ncbi:hypothetical protein VTK56DRAFT_3413 [Thermocarpiscus australiensis]